MNLNYALLLLFVAYKLAGIIDWPWWLVIAPFWLGIVWSIAFNRYMRRGIYGRR